MLIHYKSDIIEELNCNNSNGKNNLTKSLSKENSKKDMKKQTTLLTDVTTQIERYDTFADDIVELSRPRSLIVNRNSSTIANICPKTDSRTFRGISNKIYSGYNMMNSSTSDMENDTTKPSKKNDKIFTTDPKQVDAIKRKSISQKRELKESIKKIDDIIKKTEDWKKNESKKEETKSPVTKK